MDLRYSTRKLERICTDQSFMQRELGAQVAKILKRRIAELRSVSEMDDLLQGTGKWHPMTANRQGEWSANLTRNWRIVVEPDEGALNVVMVKSIEDYH